MTNEFSLSQAEPGKAPGSTFERKEMSFKTLRKRIALVAVAALAATGLSTVPANAGAGDLTVTGALVKGAASATATTATQAIGNQVIFTYEENLAKDTALYVTSDAGGSIASASTTTNASTGTSVAAINGTNYTDGVKWNIGNNGGANAADTITVGLTSLKAGTQVVKVQSLSGTTGLYTTVATLTVTWLAAASGAGISAANSTMYAIATGGTCTFGASKAGDVAAAAANADTVTSVPTGTELDICIAPRNANGDLVGITTTSTIVSSLGATAALAAASSQEEENFTPAAAPAFGPATLTAILIDNLGYSATISITVNFWSSLKTLAISPLVASAYAAADQTAPAGNTYGQYVTAAAGTLKTVVVGMTAKDSLGTVIDLATSANSTATSAWTIDSDKVAGAPADRTSDALGAAVSAQSVAGEASSTKWGVNAAYVTCSTKPEKLTLTAWGKDSDGVWLKSNSIDVYCAGAPDTVKVTVSGTSVNIDAKDANGYPVADNTSVTLAASNGSVVAPSSKATASGKFTTPATFIPNNTAASSTVTAIIGSKSGTSAPVAGTGTSVESQITSLVAAIAKLQKAINKINKRLNR